MKSCTKWLGVPLAIALMAGTAVGDGTHGNANANANSNGNGNSSGKVKGSGISPSTNKPGKPGNGASAVPELSLGVAGGVIVLIIGGTLMARGRRRRAELV